MNLLCLIALRVAWSATYTYILLLFAAASFIAFIARPRHRGEAVKRLYAGELLAADSIPDQSTGPRLHIKCLDGGKVLFERLDVEGLTSTGAVSLAATFKGSDIEIVERVTAGYPNDTPMAGAAFTLDLAGQEWRHIRWSDDDSGLWCAFTLHVREGIDFTVPLKR